MRIVNSFFLIFILLFSLILLGCQKTVEPIVYIESVDTIKYEVSQKASALDWTEELTPDALIPTDINQLTSDQFFYQSLSLSAKTGKSVYPSLKNFYPLDLSIFTKSEINHLDQIAQSIIDKKIEKTVYNEKYNYLSSIDNYLIQSFPSFSSWVLAKPFVIQDEPKILEVPIRLLGTNYHLDLFAIIEKKDNGLFVNQFIFGEKEND